METVQWAGRVSEIVGLLIASDGPATAVGDFCEIRSQPRAAPCARKWSVSGMAKSC